MNIFSETKAPGFDDLLETREEGQLSVDVFETETALIVQTLVAGVRAEDLDVTVTGDTVTIRGARTLPAECFEGTMHASECYWGAFSRSIVLPCTVLPEQTDATLSRGLLSITLKKINLASRIDVLEEADDSFVL